MPSTNFDIAIIGAGAAGLHFALAMRNEPSFEHKRILIVLNRQNDLGPVLFETMYAKYPVQKIFTYLDDQTSFAEDLDIMAGFPWSPFLRSIANYVTR